jgi:pilus assembly protein Flp/PilA
MKGNLIDLTSSLQAKIIGDEGQDLVEYALIVALIAFGATAGMSSLAAGLNTAFQNVSTTIGTYIT